MSAINEIYLSQLDFYCVCFHLHILHRLLLWASSESPVQKVWIELLPVSGSWCLCVVSGHWAQPSGMYPLGKKKADLLSLSFSSLLMIPSLSFWEDLSSPLTPVRRGRLKQLKVSSISRLAKESSRGLLGNAKRQEPQFSVHLEGRSHPSTISILIYFREVISLCGKRPLPPILTCQCHQNRHVRRAADF